MGKILVVDDEPEILEVLGDVLSAHGHVVLIAGSVDGALALLAIEVPQVEVMVSDVRMPHNGHVLVPEVERLYPEISIVMMTGFAVNGFAWPMLHKPFHMQTLIGAVADAMKARAARSVALLAARPLGE